MEGDLSAFCLHRMIDCGECFSQTGRVVATSQEARSVDCGYLTNRRGDFVCPPPGQPTTAAACNASTADRLVQLEQEKRDLLTWLGEGRCGSGWSSWGGWSPCHPLDSCPASQVAVLLANRHQHNFLLICTLPCGYRNTL